MNYETGVMKTICKNKEVINFVSSELRFSATIYLLSATFRPPNQITCSDNSSYRRQG